MPRATPLKASGNAGELSPRLHARTDFIKYPFGWATVENCIPLAEGAMMRRAGTRFVAEIKSSSVKGRLKRFQFSVTQAYALELGNQIIRFYRNQGQITVADTDAAITNGTFPSGITDWDDRSTGGAGNQISHDATNNRLTLETSGTASDDIGWAEQDVTTANLNQVYVIKFRVIGDPGDKIEFQVGTAASGAQTLAAVEKEVGYHCVAFTPTTSPFYVQFRNLGVNADKDVQIDDVSLIDNSGVEIDSPYPEADLFDIEGPQSADVLYLFHETYPTHKLQRFGHTTWSLVEVAWQDGPYLTQNGTTTTLTPGATSGLGVTITASATAGINGGAGFKSTDVGRLIRIDNPASGVDWGWAVVVGFTSTTVVTADIKRAFSQNTADVNWRLGSWSSTTGYPKAASFYEQRLMPGGTINQPQTFWGSQTADFENMTPDSDPSTAGVFDGTVEDDDAFEYTINANNVNAIFTMIAVADTLFIGTNGGEWVPKSNGAVLTPTDITVRRQTSHGLARIAALSIDNVVLFVQKAKRLIREFAFSFDVDGFRAFNMTRLAQHVTKGGLVEMDFAENPESLVYAVREDGQLLSMTYRRDEDVVGWARHIIGGEFSNDNPVVESVAVIPGTNGSGQTHDSTARDEVWIIVKRTINGDTKRYVEFFERDHTTEFDHEDAFYIDSGVTYDSTAASVLTGYDHIEGATVKILADGAVHPDRVVNGGSITLDDSYKVVQTGLGYTSKLKTLKLEAGTAAGTALTKLRRIVKAAFIVLDSQTMSFGPDEDNLESVDFRVVSDPMDAAVPLFTGELIREFDDGWSTDPRLHVQVSDPVPFTLLAIAPEIDTKELI